MGSEEAISSCATWCVYDYYRWRLDSFHYLPRIESSYRAWLRATKFSSLDPRPYGPYWKFTVEYSQAIHRLDKMKREELGFSVFLYGKRSLADLSLPELTDPSSTINRIVIWCVLDAKRWYKHSQRKFLSFRESLHYYSLAVGKTVPPSWYEKIRQAIQAQRRVFEEVDTERGAFAHLYFDREFFHKRAFSARLCRQEDRKQEDRKEAKKKEAEKRKGTKGSSLSRRKPKPTIRLPKWSHKYGPT